MSSDHSKRSINNIYIVYEERDQREERRKKEEDRIYCILYCG